VPILSYYDQDIVQALLAIKESVDAKIYDRNDILKQDAYFSQTVMNVINNSLESFTNLSLEFEDYDFIQMRLSKLYTEQYHQYWG
jgi:type I restriction enzyme R subunit